MPGSASEQRGDTLQSLCLARTMSIQFDPQKQFAALDSLYSRFGSALEPFHDFRGSKYLVWSRNLSEGTLSEM